MTAGFGQHYIPGVPITTQLPPEILLKVLGHLDPIWLFQAEAACSHIRSFLQSPASNKIWYNALPAALLAQPEYFQSEREVALVQNNQNLEVYSVSAIDASSAHFNSKVQVDDIAVNYPAANGFNSSYFTLPALTEVSGLAAEVYDNTGVHHPERKYLNQYPFIKSRSYPIRKRTLALGGPFDISISYRRELLGHLLHDGRCYICYESFNDWRSRVQRFGMPFCESCVASLTVTWVDAQKIPSLLELLARAGHGPWEPFRFSLVATEGFWRPKVDEILQSFIGTDYSTTVAKQQYFDYLHAALAPVEDGLRAAKRHTRGMIVVEAKKLWDAPRGFAKAESDAIESMRTTYAPTDKLSKFLFPDRDLYTEAVYLPHDIEASWVGDHMDRLHSMSQVLTFMLSPTRIADTARSMVLDLIKNKAKVTTLVKAAHEWHVNRLSATPTFEQLVWPPPGTRGYRGTRFNVILEKLHLVDADITCGISLTPDGEETAKRLLPKIIQASCVACPQTNMLAPRGIDGVVSHVRERHPDMFWDRKFEIDR